MVAVRGFSRTFYCRFCDDFYSYFCPKHPDELRLVFCQACKGSKGGQTSAQRRSHAFNVACGKRGGRPKGSGKSKNKPGREKAS